MIESQQDLANFFVDEGIRFTCNGFDVTGIFFDNYEDQEVSLGFGGREVAIESNNPMFIAISTDILISQLDIETKNVVLAPVANVVDRNGLLVIDRDGNFVLGRIAYFAVKIRPDSTGMTIVELIEQD